MLGGHSVVDALQLLYLGIARAAVAGTSLRLRSDLAGALLRAGRDLVRPLLLVDVGSLVRHLDGQRGNTIEVHRRDRMRRTKESKAGEPDKRCAGPDEAVKHFSPWATRFSKPEPR
jgi:hypothetical protein